MRTAFHHAVNAGVAYLICIVAVLIMWVVARAYGLDYWPATYTDSGEAIPFKMGYEITFSVIGFVLTAVLFFQAHKRKSRRLIWLGVACFMLGMRELVFLSSVSSDVFVFLGHAYSMAAYAFIAMAIFTGIQDDKNNRLRLKAFQKEINELKMALDAHAIVAVTDSRGVIIQVNDKFCSISQYAREDLIGRTHKVINSGHHPQEFFKDLWGTITLGEVWNGEVCNRAKDGSLYWVQSTIVPFMGKDGKPEQYVAIRADITLRKEAEAETRRMALHDALTGLPNRRLMHDRLTKTIQSKERYPGFGAVLLMDLDHFKEVNDTLGHALGDELLRKIAQRLIHCVRKVDTVARLGGDEFVIVLDQVGLNSELAVINTRNISEKIRTALTKPYQLGEHQLNVTPSLGVVLFEDFSDDSEELIKQADIALYSAKEAGRNQVCFFEAALQDKTNQRALIMQELRKVLEKDELVLFYQPVVNAQEKILGFEALVRWFHPEQGTISPVEFIPLAEQSGLIIPIGAWILETACRQLVQWSMHPDRGHWTMAVNVSARQFNQADFAEQIQHVLVRTGARADRLRLELTESMLHDNIDSTIVKMETLRELGIRFSLDDFGTGYSSLSYLKLLPLNQLKIDKSFVDDIFEDPSHAAIARTIMALANSLDLSVVAEGVETQQQLDWLLENGCKSFQGYLFSRPLPLNEVEAMLLVRKEGGSV
ncbi:MAG: EAL domain-containing protein [Pseudomonas sp.]|nr:EAL domain-containing protein [Pseudomonas sp.]